MGDRTFGLWVYVHHWVDGDTWHGIVDQAFGDYKGRTDKTIRCRAALINAPEKDEPAAWQNALDTAILAASPGAWYYCTSYKPDPDSFGRPILDLHLPNGQTFSSAMLATGVVVPYARNAFEARTLEAAGWRAGP